MFLGDFEGEVIVKAKDELQEFLIKRPAFDANNFILTFNEDGFPQLNVYVKKDICVIFYMDINNGNFVSYKEDEGDDGTEIFYENLLGEEIELCKENIIPLSGMYEAANEFFVSNKRPMCIEWMEL